MGYAGVVTFHNRTVLSKPPVARVCPSGVNATAMTELAWPVKGGPSDVGWAGSVTFHNRAVLS
jgi:hypothetical protein